MKVAVYTIALNEEQFVERWYNSVKDEADYLLIADTGSTDGTVEKARALGINVVSIWVKPWRFDVARNASLTLVPPDMDYCIPLDMDEIMLPGWRAELEKAFADGATRPRYNYIWNWNADGTPGLTFGGDKIHARQGYRWKNPVHEVLTPDRIVEKQFWTQSTMEHHADNTKSRSQYLGLLKASVDEDPRDDRNTFYYARELFFYNKYVEATAEFKRHLSLPNARWAPERAASMRYLGKINKEEAELWFTLAARESPGRREPHVDLAKYYYGIGNWKLCYEQSTAALAIAEKPLEYLCEAEAWGYTPYDMASISAYNLGMYQEARDNAVKALELGPETDKERLIANLSFCEAKLNDK
jgi:glycosyltransferase involved in cell wall biosynthesis